MPHVALVLMRAGRTHVGAAVAAADVGDPVRFRAGVVTVDQPPIRGAGGGGASEPDGAGAVPAALGLGGPAVEVVASGPPAHLRYGDGNEVGQRDRSAGASHRCPPDATVAARSATVALTCPRERG